MRAYGEFLGDGSAVDWTPDRMQAPSPLPVADGERWVPSPDPKFDPGPRQTLDQLLGEACRRFALTQDRLMTPKRDRYLSRVRAWIAYQAITRRVCSLAEVARVLGRDESTLRGAMRAYPEVVGS